jgi:putative sporulation protein YtaF
MECSLIPVFQGRYNTKGKVKDMYRLFYLLLISLANNLDNIGVRIAYSIRGIKISIPINLWISVITFIISGFAAYSGTLITGFLNKQWSSVISMLLLSGIGLWIIAEPYMKKKCDDHDGSQQECTTNIWHVFAKPEKADRDNSKHIDFKEATVLGVALSINNIGGGLGAGMIGLNSFWVGFFSALISFLALWAGNYITEFFTRWNIGNKATVVAGIALILIGIEQLL